MKIRVLSAAAIVLALVSFCGNLCAQYNAIDYTVPAQASVQTTPPRITLSWTLDAHAYRYAVNRREFASGDGWNLLDSLSAKTSSYTDTSVLAGIIYEYQIQKLALTDTTHYQGYGYVCSGINAALEDHRGTVVLLVDNTMAGPLAKEITQLILDLHGDGWSVIRHDVARTATVPQVKAMLKADYDANPEFRSLFILGHIAVPYSGDIAPDGHTPGNGNHQGAWSADPYYGVFSDLWSDNTVKDTTAGRPENRNKPGDGKFDQNSIPEDITIEIGRVDLSDMPAYTKSETELLRQYLNKDHAFRTGKLVAPSRALVDVNFGVFTWYDVPGEDAWRNFPPLVGNKNIEVLSSATSGGTWFPVLDTAKYLWAYGCGAGSWNSCSGVGTTEGFAANDVPLADHGAIFYMVFGSFFGDWDSHNNFTRAPLASGMGLSSCWVSRPFWFYHPMAMGQTLGTCTMLTENNGGHTGEYNISYGLRGVHLGLMGDPTLRMSYASPMTSLSASIVPATHSVNLTWAATTPASVDGYYVYRGRSMDQPFTKLTTSLVKGTSYTDPAPNGDTNIYMVRAVTLETSASGSFENAGEAIFQTLQGVLDVPSGSPVAAANSTISISMESGSPVVSLRKSGSSAARISVVDVTGKEIGILEDRFLTAGSYSYPLSASGLKLANSLYFVRLAEGARVQTAKLLIAR